MGDGLWKKELVKLIGARCARYRTSLGLTQVDIAAFAHCSIENVSAYEHGRNASLILMLAYMSYGMTYDDLIEVGVDDV